MNLDQNKIRSFLLSRKFIFPFIFLTSMGLNFLISCIEKFPGYMDAEYYYSGAYRLFHGYGFSENILWNFLDNPVSLPHPSHLYWMPLPSIISAAGMFISGNDSFIAGRLVLLFLSGFIPILTYLIAYSFRRNKRDAIFAGLISLFPGYYSVYTGNTETFTLYMLLASVFMLILFQENDYENIKIRNITSSLILGLLTGLMHLTRSDGIVWFISGFVLLLWRVVVNKNNKVVELITFITGYLLIMFPWYYRNFILFGSLFSPGAAKMLWLTNYDQLFSYPASSLSFQNWYFSGVQLILKDRLTALLMNLKNFLAVQTQIYLLPFMLAGVISIRKSKIIRFSITMWIINLVIMTILFPYAGYRGGFLHSGAALQLVMWSSVPLGMGKYISWGSKRRGWNSAMATKLFSSAIIIFGILFTYYIFRTVVIGYDTQVSWMKSGITYQKIEEFIENDGANRADTIFVNNPAGYFAVNIRPSIVIPYGNYDTLMKAANDFDVAYLVLEKNHVTGLNDLYKNPGNTQQLNYLGKVEDAQIYKIIKNE